MLLGMTFMSQYSKPVVEASYSYLINHEKGRIVTIDNCQIFYFKDISCPTKKSKKEPKQQDHAAHTISQTPTIYYTIGIGKGIYYDYVNNLLHKIDSLEYVFNETNDEVALESLALLTERLNDKCIIVQSDTKIASLDYIINHYLNQQKINATLYVSEDGVILLVGLRNSNHNKDITKAEIKNRDLIKIQNR